MTGQSLAMSDGNAVDHMSLVSGGSKKQPNEDNDEDDIEGGQCQGKVNTAVSKIFICNLIIYYY